MFKADDGLAANRSLEHLLEYEISSTELHQSAAMLSQLRNVSVTEFCSKSGYFAFDVLEHFLNSRGFKCKIIKRQKIWIIKQKEILHNKSVVGIINTVNLNAFVLSKTKWTSLNPTETLDDMLNAVVVLKMWYPVQFYYKNNLSFHITTDTDHLRHEHFPALAWKTNSVSYENLKGVVKKQLKKQRKSPIMMSNSDEIVILSPQKKGWKSETILNSQCSPIETVHQSLAEELADAVVANIKENGKGWNILAHALFSTLQQLGGQMPPSVVFSNVCLQKTRAVPPQDDAI